MGEYLLMSMTVTEQAKAWYERMRALREDLHRHPELGHKETRTTELIRKTLNKLGIETPDYGVETGIVGILRGGVGGKTLLLREDIDALPIEEKTGLSFASEVEGISHACGHDIHTAALLGTAGMLTERRNEFSGTVIFLFQCAEEVFDGAAAMLQHDIFRDEKPEAVVGLHTAPALPVGSIGILEGVADASCDTVTIRVIGRGGHGAHPDDCIDPVVIAAAIIMELQTVASRRNKPTDPMVLTFGQIQGGTAPNVIPNFVTLEGNMRCMNGTLRSKRMEDIRALAEGIASAHGARAEVSFSAGMPPVINDPGLCRMIVAAGAKVLGESRVVTDLVPSMGSDDFSNIEEACGGIGAQFLLGTRDLQIPNSGLGLHVAENIFPSAALIPAAAVLTQFALDFLRGEGDEFVRL